MNKHINKPVLRFPEFSEEWKFQKLGEVTERISNPVVVEQSELYQQIGIRSHGKGIFYKEFVDGKSLGNKRVYWVKEKALIVNIVFAWELAIAKTTDKEIGMIASHRFPMYLPLEDKSDLNYLLYFFLTKKGKSLLELASPGGAGRNKTLGQKEFENLKFLIPTTFEQKRIASFFTALDQKLTQLKQKKNLLTQYKKGVMQQLFSQALRFKADDGNEFPDWEEKKLGEVANVTMGQSPDSKSYNNEGIGKPLIQGNADIKDRKSNPRNWTSEPTKTCEIGDLILSVRAPVGTIAKSIHSACIGRGVCSIRNKSRSNIEFLYQFLLYYELQWIRLEQGSTFTAVNGTDIKGIEIYIPSIEEQTKIANFLSAIDEKINQTQTQIQKTEQYKKGLLQKMFC